MTFARNSASCPLARRAQKGLPQAKALNESGGEKWHFQSWSHRNTYLCNDNDAVLESWKLIFRLSRPYIITLNVIILVLLCYMSFMSLFLWMHSHQPEVSIRTLSKIDLAKQNGHRSLRLTVIVKSITRSSATAEKQRVSCPYEGAKPSPLWLHLCVWSNPKTATNVRQACRPLSAL